MSHRGKNLLSIAAGLTELTGRSASSVLQMTGKLTERLTALGRAHDVVRPLPGEQGKAALLEDLLSVRLAPHDEMGAFSGRIRVAVPRMGIGPRTASIPCDGHPRAGHQLCQIWRALLFGRVPRSVEPHRWKSHLPDMG